MNYKTYSFRFAEELLTTQPKLKEQWEEVSHAIYSISNLEIINHFNNLNGNPKSISKTLNALIKDKLTSKGWHSESPIYKSDEYSSDKTLRLDFAKNDISIEVGFNHGEAIAWNFIKPTLASELNHVEKAIQTKICIIITATQDLKVAGGFDGVVGTYEKYIQYLNPLRHILTVPILIIGLEAPLSFYISHKNIGTNGSNKYLGEVVMKP